MNKLYNSYLIFISIYARLKTQLFYKFLFKKIGSKSRIYSPLKLSSVHNVAIQSEVTIHKGVWLLTQQENDKCPEMTIEKGVVLGHYNHITCINQVTIQKNVITADRVYITDNYHEYEDVTIPIKLQPIKSKGSVTIGSDSWIGENVSILSSNIGKHCVIGANSVVTKDIPDYSVAVGSPARVVKKYDFISKKWVSVTNL